MVPPVEEQLPYSSPGAGPGAWFCSSPSISGAPYRCPLGLQQQGVASISLPLEAAPPYESVVTAEQSRPLPLMPCDLYKHQSEGGGGAREDSGGGGGSSQRGTDHILQED